MTKTDTDARAHLTALGLNPDAAALDHQPAQPAAQPAGKQVPLAPQGIDPHTMPVTDITFDPALLEGFDLSSPEGRRAASAHVFGLYKSYGRNKDRNSLLHREVGLFINRVRRTQETGTEHVKEQVRKGAPQRELLALLAEHGISTVEDLKGAL